MFKAFKERHPWSAALISFLLSPVVGMLYLNRGLYALWYLIASVVVAGGVVEFQHAPMPFPPMSDELAIAEMPIRVIGAVHAFFIAKRWTLEMSLKWYAHWYSIIGIVTSPLALFFAIRIFFYQSFDIPSASMEPTANPGDYFIVSRFAYDFAPPQRGDVVIFYSQKFKSYFVKRIVGLPGERIRMTNGRPAINGVSVQQRRVSDWAENCGQDSPCKVTQYQATLPGGRAFHVLNRVDHGPGDDTDVFVVPADSYFVLGDNRDNSMDSRFDMGFIPRAEIIGRAARKFFADGRWTWSPIT